MGSSWLAAARPHVYSLEGKRIRRSSGARWRSKHGTPPEPAHEGMLRSINIGSLRDPNTSAKHYSRTTFTETFTEESLDRFSTSPYSTARSWIALAHFSISPLPTASSLTRRADRRSLKTMC